MTEIHPSAMRISIRVAMHLPTIVIPKHSKSPDLFMFQFRTFSIDNTFKKTVLENGKDQDWNIFRAHLKEMQVSRYVLEVSRYVLEVSRYVLEVCIDLHLDNLIFLDISFCGQ